eukprot:TRINITY_DN3426_c0_g2_i10.p4 TRINITY_DN3426_c0_g2~~TRINITY_DN3426_c0_g2_i10.p4  ORF type:complete len:101 (+),score=13.70 TRINITY_DN3426_c0_g2_i10:1549-1851(+)
MKCLGVTFYSLKEEFTLSKKKGRSLKYFSFMLEASTALSQFCSSLAFSYKSILKKRFTIVFCCFVDGNGSGGYGDLWESCRSNGLDVADAKRSKESPSIL